MASSTPMPGRSQMIDFSTSVVSDVYSPEKSSQSKAVHPTELNAKKHYSKMLDLICEAVRAIGAPRKGASYHAIKKWIIDQGQKEKSGQQFITQFKKAFRRGIEEQLLIRKDSSEGTGLKGFFVLKQAPKVMPKKLPTIKSRPHTRVSMAVMIAKKKKKMAIMNGSLILKRKSLILSVKANDKNRNPANDLEREPGHSKRNLAAKTSEKEKLPAGKHTKEPQGKKRTKAKAGEDKGEKKTVVLSKRLQKAPKPVETKLNPTTECPAVIKALPKKQSKANTEASKMKLKTSPSDETKAAKRNQVKTTSADETEAHPENQKKTGRTGNKRKAPVNTEVFKEMSTTSDEETTATTSKQMKTKSHEVEAPLKKQPRSKPLPKKNLETKPSSETKISSKNTPPLDEPSTSEQTTTITNENVVPTKKQVKTQSKRIQRR